MQLEQIFDIDGGNETQIWTCHLFFQRYMPHFRQLNLH